MLPEVIRYLIKAGHQAPSPDNSQLWKFYWDNNTLSLCYDEKRGASGLGAQHPATLLTMGSVIENLVQASSEIGMAANLEVPIDFSSDGCYCRLHCDRLQSLPSGAWDHKVFSRHTNRLPYKKTSIPKELSAQLESICESAAGIRLFFGTEAKARVADLIRIASQVRFQTREIHEWLISSLRFTEAEVNQGDGLDLSTLDLPPGARFILRFISDWRRMAFLNEFGAYKFFAAIEAQSIKQSAGIIAVVGDNSYAGAIQAGRAMERAWILLNSKGVAVHPYFVVPDQIFRVIQGSVPAELIGRVESLVEQTSEYLKMGDKVLYMLLRIGYPVRTPVRSKRLPLQRIYQIEGG